MSWQERSLDELGIVSRGRSRHRPRDAAHLYGGPHPFVQTGDVKHAGLYLYEYSQTYSEDGLAQSRMWPAGTLCITIAANIADTAILGIDACFPDSVIGFIPDETKADVKFIKYMFDAMLKKQFKQFTQGAAQDNLSQGKLLSLKFPIPPVSEQKKIASILSAYDDLIENNRRRIQLLEQAARLLYKEWFVHLRFPGHEHSNFTPPTSNFPKGIPEGWEKKLINDVWEISYGNNLPTSRITATGKFPVHGADGIIGYHTEKNVDSSLCLVTCRGNGSGNVRRTFGPTFVTNNCFVLRPKYKSDSLKFHYAIKAMEALNLRELRTGAAQPQLTLAGINHLHAMVPSDSILSLYNSVADPLYDQADCLRKQNYSLAKARDLLLPRLMNGELVT